MIYLFFYWADLLRSCSSYAEQHVNLYSNIWDKDNFIMYIFLSLVILCIVYWSNYFHCIIIVIIIVTIISSSSSGRINIIIIGDKQSIDGYNESTTKT